MKRHLLAAAVAAAVTGGAIVAWAAGAIPAYVTAAVADAGRPQADKDRDALRKPAEVVAFAQVKPGQTVLELIPARGYFQRIISKVVGAKGRDIAALPAIGGADVAPRSNGLGADPQYPNITEIRLTPEAIAAAGPVDVIWITQNYHDLHLPMFKVDVVALDKVFFSALKPGGVLLIEDHAAAPGSGLRDVQLHRIDEATVKEELKAAGFKLEAESDILHDPADPHTAVIFDPSIRGHTDQFLLRFRKPK